MPKQSSTRAGMRIRRPKRPSYKLYERILNSWRLLKKSKQRCKRRSDRCNKGHKSKRTRLHGSPTPSSSTNTVGRQCLDMATSEPNGLPRMKKKTLGAMPRTAPTTGSPILPRKSKRAQHTTRSTSILYSVLPATLASWHVLANKARQPNAGNTTGMDAPSIPQAKCLATSSTKSCTEEDSGRGRLMRGGGFRVEGRG